MELKPEDLPTARSGRIDRLVAREGGVIAMFTGVVVAIAGTALAVFGKKSKTLSLNQVKAAGIAAAGAGTAIAALGKASYSSARDAYGMDAVREVLQEEEDINRLLQDEAQPSLSIQLNSFDKNGDEKTFASKVQQPANSFAAKEEERKDQPKEYGLAA